MVPASVVWVLAGLSTLAFFVREVYSQRTLQVILSRSREREERLLKTQDDLTSQIVAMKNPGAAIITAEMEQAQRERALAAAVGARDLPFGAREVSVNGEEEFDEDL